MTAVLAPRALGTVVVADDDTDIRDLLAAALGRTGYDVVAYDGNCADLAASLVATFNGVDVVACVLDVNMPGASGLDLCAAIKRDPRIARTPVLITSSNSAPDDVVASLAAGADAFLPKPFSPRELARRVNELVAAGR